MVDGVDTTNGANGNSLTVPDHGLVTGDLVEYANTTGNPISLLNWSLTDDASDPTEDGER